LAVDYGGLTGWAMPCPPRLRCSLSVQISLAPQPLELLLQNGKPELTQLRMLGILVVSGSL
jgi:hypothetical protein